MEIPTLKGEPRKVAGSRAAARLRRAGKLPAIVYGHQIEPLPVTLDYHEVELQLKHGAHVINLDVRGKVQPCLFKDAQYDHLGAKVVHVDLARVSLTERVKVRVPLVLRGQPKGTAEGGVLHQELVEMEVECPALQIPEAIRVDVSGLELNQVLYVKELTLDENLKVLTDIESVVATVREPTTKVEEVEAAAAPTAEAAAAAAEPEVIAKGKAEEEEGKAES
ncbi:MAG TPA: 50S ribosomal protein L25 [Phycisphaerae bacterium]|nr:50S ribosomal protein L25 [Phycisphaerae bacterium]